MNICINFHSRNTTDAILGYCYIEWFNRNIPPKLDMLEDTAIVEDWVQYNWRGGWRVDSQQVKLIQSDAVFF